MKLQLQKMHFGPPPSVLPVRSPDSEDKSGHSEDLLFQSSHETSGETVTPQGILNKVIQVENVVGFFLSIFTKISNIHLIVVYFISNKRNSNLF